MVLGVAVGGVNTSWRGVYVVHRVVGRRRFWVGIGKERGLGRVTRWVQVEEMNQGGGGRRHRSYGNTRFLSTRRIDGLGSYVAFHLCGRWPIPKQQPKGAVRRPRLHR